MGRRTGGRVAGAFSMLKRRPLMKAWVMAALAAASAASVTLLCASAGAQPAKGHRIVVYGKEPCPRAQKDDEIVVCARRPETERYRIPKELRDSAGEDDPDGTSWAARAEPLEYVGRSGLESCSTAGSGGASGCWNESVRGWRRDRGRSDGVPER
jgi:hypothetical protein